MFVRNETESKTSRHIAPRRRASRGRRPTWPLLVVGALAVGTAACGEEVKVIDEQETQLRRCRPEGPEGQTVVLHSSDEEIESFVGCQILEGSLHVDHQETDLSPLSSLVVIEGSISGGGYQLKPFDLAALHNLDVVGEDLYFLSDNITSFQGLSKVHTVGGSLFLSEVLEIENLRGLENVRSLARLTITFCPKLRTLAGLDGLEKVQGDVTIKGNPLVPAEQVDALLARIEVGGKIVRE